MPSSDRPADEPLPRGGRTPPFLPLIRVSERRLRRGGRWARAAVRLVGVAVAVWVVRNHGWLWLLVAIAAIFVVALFVEWLIHRGPEFDVSALAGAAGRAAERGGLVCPACGLDLPPDDPGRCPGCGRPYTPAQLRQDWGIEPAGRGSA